MDTAGTENKNNSLTPSQRDAVAARGNVLVMAGAGTGKTHTLVERCLDLICKDRVSLNEMLIVTFTEAAATEVRERLREGLEQAAARRPSDTHLPEQLALFDAAHLGTLHSFCFKLVREHFHALDLDPQLTVLDEAQARLLADEILEEQFQSHYENEDPYSLTAQDLITVYGNGRDDSIRGLVLRLHHYVQTRADAENWLARQIEGFSSTEPAQWREWYLKAVQEWRDEWVPILRAIQAENVKAAECLEILEQAETVRMANGAATGGRAAMIHAFAPLFRKIAGADRTESYPYRKKILLRKPLEGFFDDAEFLGSLLPKAARGPLTPRSEEDAQVEGDNERAGVREANSETRQEAASIQQTGSVPVAMPPAGIALPAVTQTAMAAVQTSRRRKSAAMRREEANRDLQLDFFGQSGTGKPAPGPAVQGRQPGVSSIENPAVPEPAMARAQTGPPLIEDDSPDPLREDWEWSRGHMKTLLLLAKEFGERFSARKRADGVLDFHDLEQFAIKLLAGRNAADAPPDLRAPTAVAGQWRNKLRFIFVDEYQDINAAQDKIISALGADNRFLVGDVKQSIYRFRLADPAIFRNYAKNPAEWKARVIPLSENFRSREGLLDFVNSIFESLMSEDLGGVHYDKQAKLKFGSPGTRAGLSAAQNPGPRVEMLLREKKRGESAEAPGMFSDDSLADLQDADLEALTVARRLREVKESGHLIWDDGKLRAAQWSDFAVLLRSPGSKAEVYAKQFAGAGVPLHVERGGFYDSAEILDLLSLLQLADNPLQDVSCIAVLRSPLVGCSLDELAEIRMAGHGRFWFALDRAAAPGSRIKEPTREKIQKFLKRFFNWRVLARQASLSGCLDAILADTHYDDWLLSRPNGAHRHANVQRFLLLAEQFDAFQRQGLFRFLKFVDAQREIEAEPDVAPLAEENAVRLMSIHQSKGLEFPVAVLADLGKSFNEQDLRGEIILDEQFGLCPKVKPPATGGRYPSLAYWLARKNQRRELRGEELRLLYVALTRARDTLILSGGVSAKKWDAYFSGDAAFGPRDIGLANSCMDWLGMWFAIQGTGFAIEPGARGESPLLRWQVVDDSQLKTQIPADAGAKPIQDSASHAQARGSVSDKLSDDKLKEILNWQYPFGPATQRVAKTSVTALRREAADDEAEQLFRRPARRARVEAAPVSKGQRAAGRLNAADAGIAHHKFLQHFAFETATDLKWFAAEAERLEEEHYLSADEVAALDLEALFDFWASETGKKIRANAGLARRELAFTAGFAPAELDEVLGKGQGGGLDGEMIVVQGVADLAVLLPKEIWLVDFKTDDFTEKDLAGKIKSYSPQLKLYARALEKIYSRPVTDCSLYFLAVKKTIPIGTVRGNT